jgi:hypothetical protein
LDRQPAAEVIPGTVMTWLEVLTTGREFVPERDRERFRYAFRTLAGRCTHWPAPREFLEALPSLPGAPKVLRIDSDDNKRRGMQALTDIAERMGVDRHRWRRDSSSLAGCLKTEPVKPYTEVDDDSVA